MTRLRIAHLIDLDRVGGVESMYVNLIQSPAPDGWQVEHHTIADSLNLAPRFRPVVERYSRSLVSPKVWHGIKLPRKPGGLRARNRLAQIRAIRPDIVLAWNQFTDFGLPPNLGCPLIYYEHGMSWYEHAPAQLQGFLPYVTAAIAASTASARMLQLKHAVSFPVTVCRNPLAQRQDHIPALPRQLPQGRTIVLGQAARLVPLKAIGILVLAVGLLRKRGWDVQARIVGEGPERSRIEQLIRQAGLSNVISLSGLCDDMLGFYREIDLFVQTSMHESLSLVCLEAMAQGVPVIASRVDGIPEVVPDGIAGLCLSPEMTVTEYAERTGASTQFTRTVYDPAQDAIIPARLLSPEQLADSIEALLGLPERYAAFSAAAIEHAAQGFGFDAYVQQFYALLANWAAKA